MKIYGFTLYSNYFKKKQNKYVHVQVLINKIFGLNALAGIVLAAIFIIIISWLLLLKSWVTRPKYYRISKKNLFFFSFI